MKETIVDEEFIDRMKEFRKKPEGLSLFEACSGNVVLFAEHMLGWKLRAWQVYFARRIQDAVEGKIDQRKFLALTSRQVGKTELIAIVALWACVFNKYARGNDNDTIIGMISASDEQAKKLLKQVKKRIRSGDLHMQQVHGVAPSKIGTKTLGFFSALLAEDEPNNTTTITFKPYKPSYGALLRDSRLGSSIASYPPTSIVLGKTFTMCFIDEAGKSERISDDFYYELAPTFDEYDAVVVYTSTPWQPSGFFYEFADPDEIRDDNDVERVLFTIDCIRIEAPKRYERTLEEIARLNAAGRLDEVQRSYYCRFVKGEQSYFDPSAVDAVFADYSMVYESKELCDMGIDFGGQRRSRTVITITKLNPESGIIMRMFHKAYPVQRDLNLIDDVESLLASFNVQRIIPDDCPEGDHLIRQMRERKGWNVHPMNFRSDKVKKYGAFRSSVNKGLVRSYEDPELRVEMKALENSEGSRQSLIQAAPGYTDDLIDSFVMSCYFFVQNEGKFRAFDLDEVDADEDEEVVVAPRRARWWKQ
jgi:hypothetical protein